MKGVENPISHDRETPTTGPGTNGGFIETAEATVGPVAPTSEPGGTGIDVTGPRPDEEVPMSPPPPSDSSVTSSEPKESVK